VPTSTTGFNFTPRFDFGGTNRRVIIHISVGVRSSGSFRVVIDDGVGIDYRSDVVVDDGVVVRINIDIGISSDNTVAVTIVVVIIVVCSSDEHIGGGIGVGGSCCGVPFDFSADAAVDVADATNARLPY
jgi:hypothetical protein